MSREAFGPTLRRIRMRQRVSIEAIAERTRVPADLWHGLERNDLSGWPTGIFARGYVRQYAEAIGVDPDATVDEFCRWFPQGDRRAARIVRGQAELIGHQLHWRDDLIGSVIERDRRQTPSSASADGAALATGQRGRIVAAGGDAAVVIAVGLAMAALLPIGKLAAIGLSAVAYHAISMAMLGCSPTVWALDTYILNRHPAAGNRRFVRLVRNSVRVKV
jgi:transcriptional regulator with XRE-family HTH domain